MSISYLENGKVAYVGSTFKSEKDAWFKAVCKPGKYFVSIYTSWKSFVNECTLTIYGPNDSKINLIELTEKEKLELEDVIVFQHVDDCGLLPPCYR